MNKELLDILVKLAYLLASVLFILGIKRMGKTKTAREGNRLSAIAMLIAVVAILVEIELVSIMEIAIAVAIGGLIGAYYARTVEMTQMPEMVALFNGFGGLASVTVAFSEYYSKTQEMADANLGLVALISASLSLIIGSVTFTGSLIAWGKLSGNVKGQAITFGGQHALNLILALTLLAAAVLTVAMPANPMYAFIVIGLGLLLGVLTVIPIGGADMPVVISLLNSYSGVAACTTGFVLNNQVLIIAGALVGASGLILTNIMCKAMNRSLVSVLLGGFGQTGSGGGPAADTDMVIKEVGIEETAMLFDTAESAIIVPGYGMAVAQAQHVVRELMDLLEERGTEVRFAIHPVAGRMPGHMNVLLAEANVPYDKLVEMDSINDSFSQTDIALIIGANDVVNPDARNNPDSPIYGMPILNADQARTVIVCKRSMNVGYAGIQNRLFGNENTLMLFGDAKQTMTGVVAEIKEAD